MYLGNYCKCFYNFLIILSLLTLGMTFWQFYFETVIYYFGGLEILLYGLMFVDLVLRICLGGCDFFVDKGNINKMNWADLILNIIAVFTYYHYNK